MRTIAFAALLLVAACAQTPKTDTADASETQKTRRVCTETDATTGSRTTAKRTCRNVPVTSGG